MNHTTVPLTELTATATHLLCQEIGVVNTARYINQFTTGYGDYVYDRDKLFEGMTVDDIVEEIMRQRKDEAK